MLIACKGQNNSMMHHKYIIGTSPWMYKTKDRLGLIVTGLVPMSNPRSGILYFIPWQWHNELDMGGGEGPPFLGSCQPLWPFCSSSSSPLFLFLLLLLYAFLSHLSHSPLATEDELYAQFENFGMINSCILHSNLHKEILVIWLYHLCRRCR